MSDDLWERLAILLATSYCGVRPEWSEDFWHASIHNKDIWRATIDLFREKLSAQGLMIVPSDTEEALKSADKALDVMWQSYDRGEHGGSPGEWIFETMNHVETLIERISALKAAEGQNNE